MNNAITLKLPDDLHAALKEVSAKRRISKSAVVREALEQSLLAQGDKAAAAERWVERWRGRFKEPAGAIADPRLAHIYAKHLR
jgi:predicted transcriptional regulator